MTSTIVVYNRWNEIFDQLQQNISEFDENNSSSIFQTKESIWEIISSHYNESHRKYHNLTHIANLLQMSKIYESILIDRISVDLAIIFHDVIYNPKASDNEELSAKLFEKIMSPYLSKVFLVTFHSMTTIHMEYLDILDKVAEYIRLTKLHSVQNSSDYDLKLFIDMDMSILGSDIEIYQEYAKQIREEYCHVSVEDYCKGRRMFLSKMLAAELSTDPMDTANKVFSTIEFQIYHDQLIRNLEWECGLLEKGSPIGD